MDAIPASISQYGTGHASASSNPKPALSGCEGGQGDDVRADARAVLGAHELSSGRRACPDLGPDRSRILDLAGHLDLAIAGPGLAGGRAPARSAGRRPRAPGGS